jgi:predicted permease
MPSERDNASTLRRFSIWELCVYVTAVCMCLGVLRALTATPIDVSPGVECVLVFIAFGALGVFGACLGVPVALVLSGRRGVAAGAILGVLEHLAHWCSGLLVY